MKTLTIYYDVRTIQLFEKTSELVPEKVHSEISRPIVYKSNEMMKNVLNNFFENIDIKEIAFEHKNFEKMFNDFKSHFIYLEAAGGIVKNSENQLLVIHKFGKPDLPKGKIETGETPEEAAVREVEEETGIKKPEIIASVEPTYHIYLIKGKKFLKKTHWYQMRYSGNEVLKPERNEGISTVEWCNSRILQKYSEETYLSIQKFFI
jgi:8-oxo-dGTP pyrophosphatase MutT (NUDIX family)